MLQAGALSIVDIDDYLVLPSYGMLYLDRIPLILERALGLFSPISMRTYHVPVNSKCHDHGSTRYEQPRQPEATL